MKREWIVPAAIDKVIDGDTIVATLDLGWHIAKQQEHIRIAGINAPEMNTPEGVDARDFAMSLLLPEGTVVTLTSHSLDKYGRTLGSLTLADGRDFATVMVAEGHAVPYHP